MKFIFKKVIPITIGTNQGSSGEQLQIIKSLTQNQKIVNHQSYDSWAFPAQKIFFNV